MTAPTLQERAMKAAEEAADLQYPGQDGVAAQLRGEHVHGYHNGYIAGAKAERIAALEEAARLVCPWCRRSEPFNGRGHYLDGREMPCYADTIHAAIAREREAGKGKGE